MARDLASASPVLETAVPPATRRRPPWLVYAACGVLLGVYQGLNQFLGVRSLAFAPWEPFVWELSSVLVVLALLPLVVRFERRFRLDSKPRSRVALAHAAALLAFSVAHTSGMVLLRKLAYALAGGRYEFGNVWVSGLYELQKDVILYAIILVVVFAVREFRTRRSGELRAARLSADLSDARLRHLTAQIEPHFLFNSLNAISNRMREDVDAADRMIVYLGDLLRAAYESDRSVLVPLGHELKWLRGYAAVMAERFGGELEFELAVEPGLSELRVPRLLLQPIVENAFEHGLAEGGGSLQVEVRRAGARLEYVVRDDGAGLRGGARAPATRRIAGARRSSTPGCRSERDCRTSRGASSCCSPAIMCSRW